MNLVRESATDRRVLTSNEIQPNSNLCSLLPMILSGTRSPLVRRVSLCVTFSFALFLWGRPRLACRQWRKYLAVALSATMDLSQCAPKQQTFDSPKHVYSDDSYETLNDTVGDPLYAHFFGVCVI